MKTNFELAFRQEQKFLLSPKMEQAIHVLQMSNYELHHYIDEVLQENFFLDVSSSSEKSSKDVPDKEVNYKEIIDSCYSSQGIGSHSDQSENPLLLLSKDQSLKEFLEEQIRELCTDKLQEKICLYLIENIDHRGYLDISLQEAAHCLKIHPKHIEDALSFIHHLEPSGIGARNLKECLKIQLVKKGIQDQILYKIVDSYLESIAENKYALIAKELHIDLQKVQKYADLIKTLNPKPSTGFFTGERAEFIVPDISIHKIDGKYHILLNDGYLPHLIINNNYKKILENETDRDAAAYLKERLNKAVFLLENIEKRKNTLYRIVEVILEIQKNYLEYGKQYLKPMTLKDIAALLHMNESTVSRAIKDKYISTSRGTVKMKELFSAQWIDNEDSCTSFIKDTIKEIISSEDPMNPLSDQLVCNMLNHKNINISRRTIAKYREELGIKPSKMRKRF